jgi:hypothetical protein
MTDAKGILTFKIKETKKEVNKNFERSEGKIYFNWDNGMTTALSYSLSDHLSAEENTLFLKVPTFELGIDGKISKPKDKTIILDVKYWKEKYNIKTSEKIITCMMPGIMKQYTDISMGTNLYIDCSSAYYFESNRRKECKDFELTYGLSIDDRLDLEDFSSIGSITIPLNFVFPMRNVNRRTNARLSFKMDELEGIEGLFMTLHWDDMSRPPETIGVKMEKINENFKDKKIPYTWLFREFFGSM